MPIFNLQMCVDTKQEANLSTLFELLFMTYTVTDRAPTSSSTARIDVKQKRFNFLIEITKKMRPCSRIYYSIVS
jgi:hypothetical protein